MPPWLHALEQARGKGRDDYPIRVRWFCARLQPLLRHPTMEQTLAETLAQRFAAGGF